MKKTYRSMLPWPATQAVNQPQVARPAKAWHRTTFLALLTVILSLWQVRATGFTDSFEVYAPGILDATYSGGPNEGASGGPNPWFAAYPAVGMRAVGTEFGVVPHNGTNMIRGHTYNGILDSATDWYNLSYRCATGGVYFGNIALDWWFYDPLGSGGGGQYSDYVALCNYDGVATDTDYYSWPTFGSQRMSLGAYMPGVGTSVPNYQARIVGATDGVNSDGWFYLTNATRSIGWHHARIVIGAANGAATPASFYIDNMVTPALTHATVTDTGFNLLEINADFGNTTGYFDDFTFQDNAFAPAIGAGPTNLTVHTTATATFAVSGVSGNPAPSCFWQKNGSPLINSGRFSGVNTATLTISSTVESDAGSYSCLVSNIAGTATTTAALSLIVPPTIDTQSPQGGTVFAGSGSTVSFSVTAHASNLINYQWKKGGANLSNVGHVSGATNANLTITGFDATDVGVYTCHLSNADGSADSTAVTLALAVAPAVNVQPTNQIVALGASASFTVGAAGTSLSFQWKKGAVPLNNGPRVSGATSSALGISSVVDADAGSYSCVITNASGSTNTDAVTLTVIDPPVITTHPLSQVASNGFTVVLHVAATGTSPAYQWKKNGNPLSNSGNFSGVTTPDLTIHVTSTADEGIYTVTVTNLAGSPTSSGAVLRVNQATFSFFDDFETYSINDPITYGRLGTPLDHNYGDNPVSTDPWWGSAPPNFFTFPSGQDGATAYSGNQMIGGAFNTVTSGDNDEGFLNLAYRFNGGQRYYGNIMLDWHFYDPGASDYGDQLALANFAANMPSNDDSSGYNMPGSPVQQLFVGAWPNLDTTKYQASIIGVSDGTEGIISKNIVGTTKYFDTTALRSAGWHHARILVGPAQAETHVANARFYVDDMVTPAFSHDLPPGNVGFNSIHTLACSVFPPASSETAGFFDALTFQAANDPNIIEQPVSVTTNYGANASFSVVAMATSYQWQKNGSGIGGATSAILTLNAVSSLDDGAYTCMVSGVNGSFSSSPATLTVIGSPPFLTATLAGQKVVIAWAGSYPLLSATNVAGPYAVVTGATSPYTNSPPLGSRQFFGLGR